MNSYGPGDRPKHTPDEPWWNDKDRAGGLFATISLLTVVVVISIVLIACAVKFVFWLF